MADYIATIYNDAERPKTDYPAKLAAYLVERFALQQGMTLMEVGCGRCEFLKGFRACALDVCGVDISTEAPSYAPEIPIYVANCDNDPLPAPDNSLDVVYSKSLVEHLYYPERYFAEAMRVLRPGGVLVTLVPDWESCFKTYFDDYTHRTPFTRVTLKDMYRMCNYTDIEVARFRQLPIVWKHPWINVVCATLAPFVPVRTNMKFLRWSRELMVLGIGRKGAR